MPYELQARRRNLDPVAFLSELRDFVRFDTSEWRAQLAESYVQTVLRWRRLAPTAPFLVAPQPMRVPC